MIAIAWAILAFAIAVSAGLADLAAAIRGKPIDKTVDTGASFLFVGMFIGVIVAAWLS